MSDSNVVQFRRREPKTSATEIEMYRRTTRNWSDEVRQLMFPALFELDSKSDGSEARQPATGGPTAARSGVQRGPGG
jgi:hypothetical protein